MVPVKPLDPISTAPPEVFNEEGNGPDDNKPGDRSIYLLPYNILTQCFTFQNKDHEAWWHSIIPTLVTLLSIAKYRVSTQYDWLRFVQDHVVPLLDAPPLQDSLLKWKSSLTPFHIPIQLSMGHRKENTIVRLTFEPVGTMAGTPSDPYNRAAITEAVGALTSELGFDWRLFYLFKSELTLSDLEVDILQSTEVREDDRSQAFISMELGKSRDETSVRCFFVPHLKSLASGVSAEQLILGAIRKTDVDGSFSESILPVQKYLGTCNRDTSDVVMFGCDLTDPDKSRITIHIAEWDVQFNNVREFFTLNDTLKGPSTMAGLADMRDLWKELKIPEGNRKDCPKSSKSSSSSVPLLFSFELHPRDPQPKLKVYIPLHGLSDMDTAFALVRFYERFGWGYMKDIPGYICGIAEHFRDMLSSSHRHLWVSYSICPVGGASMSVHFHPMQELPRGLAN